MPGPPILHRFPDAWPWCAVAVLDRLRTGMPDCDSQACCLELFNQGHGERRLRVVGQGLRPFIGHAA